MSKNTKKIISKILSILRKTKITKGVEFMSNNTKKIIVRIIFVLIGVGACFLAPMFKNSSIPLLPMVLMELFVTIHMTIFVFSPLAALINDESTEYRKSLIRLSVARALFLLLYDLFISPGIAIIDFFLVFVGAFTVGVTGISKGKMLIPSPNIIKNSDQSLPTSFTINGQTVTTTGTTTSVPLVASQKTIIKRQVSLKCPNCGNMVKIESKSCPNCGKEIDEKMVQDIMATLGKLEPQLTASSTPGIVDPAALNAKFGELNVQPITYVKPTDFDPMYSLENTPLIEAFINKALDKAHVDKTLIPKEVLTRKQIFYIIFCILLFCYISMIFFHFPLLTYIVGLIVLLLLLVKSKKYNMMEYLKKELNARRQEKISNIVMATKENVVPDSSKKLLILGIIVAIIAPLILFSSPRILYEKTDNGYAVRFYIFGLTNYKTATIPSTYKGEPVVSLRGNTFSNMFFLEKVTLPNTITEIRGQAFKNNIKLKEVELPKELTYLGGGAFYNCSSLTSIVLPDTLTYMGGEVFMNASSLETVILSENLTEIRGNSFENCTSLSGIVIPDNIKRIGGHAFYNNTALSGVYISENSQLREIGSSAFRLCPNLYTINVPATTYINVRAFKESPTIVNRYS